MSYAVLFKMVKNKDDRHAVMCASIEDAELEAAMVLRVNDWSDPQLFELVPGEFKTALSFSPDRIPPSLTPLFNATRIVDTRKPVRRPAKVSTPRKRRKAAKAGTVRLPKNGKKHLADMKRLRTRVLSCIASFSNITKVEVSKKLEVSVEKLNTLFPSLLKEKLIGKKGTGANTKYRPLVKK